MHLYLMRHGVAIDRDDPLCPPDPDRPLTAMGVDRTRAAAYGLVTMGVVVDRILSSPFVRSTDTASILAEALGVPRMAVETVPWLTPETPMDEMEAGIRGFSGDGLLCIGHSPSLDELVARLCHAPVPATRLKKAGVAVLDLTAPRIPTGADAPESTRPALLRAVLEPRVLRLLGRFH